MSARTAPRSRNTLRRLPLTAPATLAAIILGVYPLVFVIAASFSDSSLGRVFRSWVGLEQYAAVIADTDLVATFARSLMYAVAVTVASVTLGVISAFALNHAVRAGSSVRVVVITPMLLAPVVVATVWKLVVNPGGGPISVLLHAAGVPRDSFAPLADPNLALVTIAVADVWEWTPLVTLLVSAALLSVDPATVEAARLDGAHGWRMARSITLPAIAGVIAAAAFIRFVLALKIFDLVFTMTNGGPGQATMTTSYAIYQSALREFDVGRAAALTVLLALVVTLIMVPVAVVTRKLQRNDH